jgi:hypothetical protein
METVVVVSKFTEDVSWLDYIKHKKVVYDKSDNPIDGSYRRPNVGREAETFLHYIITNYYTLPDIVIFLQGDPRSNPVSYTHLDAIRIINNDHPSELKPILTWSRDILDSSYWLKSVKILNDILFENGEIINYSSGVQYVVPKRCITQRPIDLYLLLYSLVLKFGLKPLDIAKDNVVNGVDPWTLELIWGNIFDEKKILKSNYYTELLKNLQGEV